MSLEFWVRIVKLLWMSQHRVNQDGTHCLREFSFFSRLVSPLHLQANVGYLRDERCGARGRDT